MKKVKEYFYFFLFLMLFIILTFPVLKIYDYFKPNPYKEDDIVNLFDDIYSIEKTFLDSLNFGKNNIANIKNKYSSAHLKSFGADLFRSTGNDSSYIKNKYSHIFDSMLLQDQKLILILELMG